MFKIHWDAEDVERVTAVIKRGVYWAIGPEVREFERRCAEYLGVRHALAVNSGTSALHVILVAHGIGAGDEVIVPSFTFVATANAPLFVGARPVFAEIEGETYGLDPRDAERRITPRTKAIMPIHYGGAPCQIEALKDLAHKHNLVLIEDAAESFGARVNEQKTGSFGDSAILSFCSNKVITTGEGGMIVTDSDDVFEKAQLMHNHGRAETSDYFSATEQMDYVALGHNYRMSTMTAALGLSQLNKIDGIIQMRRENAEYLSERLSGVDEIETPREAQGRCHVYQMYTIRIRNDKGVRDQLREYLVRHGVMCRVYFHPVHLTRFYRSEFGFGENCLPYTEKLASEVLTLPMYPGLTCLDMDYIVDRIKSFFTEVRI